MRGKNILVLLCLFSFCVFGTLCGCAEPEKPGVLSEEEWDVARGEEPAIPGKEGIEEVTGEDTRPGEAEFPITTEMEEIVLEQKFSPGDLLNYKVVTEATKSVDFSGSMTNQLNLQGGRTGTKVEMTFSQEIESVDEEGDALLKITIKGLKYFFEERSLPKIDFDSSREKDKSKAFAKLIGQSYRIKLTPSGEVSELLDADSVRRSVTGASEQSRRAAALLTEEVIERRHGIAGLPASDEKQLKAGAHWSEIKNVSFGMMGEKSFEKMYKPKGINRADGQRIITVEMNAIPTASSAQELYKQNKKPSLTQLFDNIEKYTGELKLNLDTGKVIKYHEKMESKWIMVDPEAARKGDAEPGTITMEAVRFHRLEKLD